MVDKRVTCWISTKWFVNIHSFCLFLIWFAFSECTLLYLLVIVHVFFFFFFFLMIGPPPISPLFPPPPLSRSRGPAPGAHGGGGGPPTPLPVTTRSALASQSGVIRRHRAGRWRSCAGRRREPARPRPGLRAPR